jgi:DNA-binding FrmR family transcriptional regulator
MVRTLTLPILLLAAVPELCLGQGAQTSASQPAPATPQTQTASASAAPDDSNQPSANGSATPAKKVWTNEDIKSAGPRVSVVGDKRNQKYTMTKSADQATVNGYKTRLKKLQGQLDDVNKQLEAYKEFQQGKAVSQGGEDMSHGYSRTPVPQQISKLEDKKKNLESQMDELYDEARKKGIESGQLD